MTEPTTIEVPHLGDCPDCEYLGDQPDNAQPTDQNRARLTSALVATVVFLTAIAPLATDMYVPAFPQVATEAEVSRAWLRSSLGDDFGRMVAEVPTVRAIARVRWFLGSIEVLQVRG
jgi:hypothetical protein